MVYLSTYKTGYKGAVNTLAALIITTKVVAIMTDSNVSNSVEQGKEIWKDIEGYDGMYQVSNKGRVRSFNTFSNVKKRETRPKVMSPMQLHDGYLRVCLTKDKNKKYMRVHRLVINAFNSNKDGKPQVNHIDGDKENNNIKNLEWSTAKENTQHAIRNGLRDYVGENNPDSKISKTEALDIRIAYKLGCFSYQELANAYNLDKSTIGRIIRRETWKHI